MEAKLSRSDIHELIGRKYNCSDFEVIEWTFKKDELTSGFFGYPSREYIAIKLESGEIRGLHLFIRRLPTENYYHKDLLDKLGIFSKEIKLYEGMLKDLLKYIEGKIYPEFHIAKRNNTIILEDLTLLGFKCNNPRKTFSVEQIESAIQTLSKLHAASIIMEDELGEKLDKIYCDSLFETQFVSDINHPWFHNGCTSMNAIESIVEAYFPQIDPEVYEKAYDAIRTLPYRMSPSRKYLNVFSHGGLTSNHILFKYNGSGEVIESVLSNFQNARYHTPALDVLLAIYLTTNSTLRTNNFECLTVHYYNCLSRELAESDIDIKSLMTWEQFKNSLEDCALTAQGIAVVYLHLMLLPTDKISTLLRSEEVYREFIEVDRTNVILEEMRLNNSYRKRMVQAISELFNNIQNNKKNIYN